MRRGKPKRVGISTVVGTMLFVLAMLAGLAAIAQLYSLSVQTQTAAQSVANLQAAHNRESLSYQALGNGTLAVSNTGPSGSTILATVLKFANGTVYEFAPNRAVSSGGLLNLPGLIPTGSTCGGSTCISKYNSILSSTNTGDSIGLVTSLGNAFWVKPAQAVQTDNPQLTTQITFDAQGTSSFGTTAVVTVDSMGYTSSQLPRTLTWFVGTRHTYSYTTSVPQGTGVRVGVSSMQGISTSASGTITATSPGTIRTSYTTQYQLTANGGNGITFIGSPTNDGWYDSGSTGQFTSNYAWSVASGSRQNLISYSLDGSSPTSVTRSGTGIYASSPITMTAPHTFTLNSVAQHLLTISGGDGVGYSLASQTSDNYYDAGSTLTVSSNYAWNQVTGQSRQNLISYALDGTTTNAARVNSGTFTTPTITMSGAHALTFNPVTQYFLTVSGGSGTVLVGSQTNDGWFDSGSNAQAQSVYSWNTVAGQSRSNLYSYALDGGSPTAIASRTGSGTYTTPTIAMSTYHTLAFNPVAQYYFTVNGGSNVVYVNSQTGDGWYDSGTTIAQISTNNVWSVVSGQSRQDLISWNVDGGSNTIVGSRSGTGSFTTTSVTMNSYHALNFNGIAQYYLTTLGGSGVTVSGSQTGDGWFDSGSTGTATANYVWSVTAGQSRLNVLSWNLDGGANQAVSRSNTGTYTTTSVTMNTFHTINFNSVTQYYITVQNSAPSSGSVPALTVSYQDTSPPTTVSQALTNPGFETGSWPPWDLTCGIGSNSISTTTVHLGTYSGFISYPNDGGQCAVSQSFTVPNGGQASSTTGSAWVYSNQQGTAWIHATCGPYWGPAATATNSWQQISLSNSCASGTASVTFYMSVQGNCIIKCYTESADWDDAVFGYTYTYPQSGTFGSGTNSFTRSGSVVTYSYGVGYGFPSGATSRQLQVPFPSTETYASISCGTPSVSGSTVTIPDSSIASCGASITITTTYSGSYSTSISASQTSDSWYDSGTVVTVTGAASGPFSFGGWTQTGALAIGSTTAASTTITVSSYDTVTGNFNVGA